MQRYAIIIVKDKEKQKAIGTMIGGQLMEIQIDLPAFICSISYAISTILLYIFFKND